MGDKKLKGDELGSTWNIGNYIREHREDTGNGQARLEFHSVIFLPPVGANSVLSRFRSSWVRYE